MTFRPLIVAVLVVTYLTVFAPFADGNQGGNQSNQSLNQPSVLVAPKPDFKINVYPKPGN